jgi:hypothetical protein
VIRWGEPISSEEEKIRDIYRTTFSSPEGREALMYILTDLGFFDATKDDVGQALRNFAVRLLEQMGILHETNAEHIVEQFFKLAPYDIKTHRNIGGQEDE